MSKIILVLGLGLLIATGYQIIAYRELLRLAQQELDGLPTSLLLQLIAATILSLIGGILNSGEFKPISVADNPSSINSKPFNFATCAVYNTRGRAFASLPHIKANMPQVPSTTTS